MTTTPKPKRSWKKKTQLFYYANGSKERPKVKRAAARVGESVSTFAYRATIDRADKILGEL